ILLQSLILSLRLLQMTLECLTQFVRARCLGQLWQRLGQLFLGVIRILKLLDEHVMQRFALSHALSFDFRTTDISKNAASSNVEHSSAKVNAVSIALADK